MRDKIVMSPVSSRATPHLVRNKLQKHGRYGQSFPFVDSGPGLSLSDAENKPPASELVISQIIAHVVVKNQSTF